MVRHLIVFNIRKGAAAEECLEMAEEGRVVLSQIPGVLHVSFGVAMEDDARYKYSFVIDFADASVIESYKHHPLHVRFADERFRPLCPDRMTTDYTVVY